MAKDYKSVTVEYQGSGSNYCWAACLAWWLKAVRGYTNYSQDDIAYRYADYTHDTNDGNQGALTEQGMKKLLNDPSWHLWYATWEQSKVDEKRFDELLSDRGPFMIGYTDYQLGKDDQGNDLAGFHMNVIIEKDGDQYLAMDPNHREFVKRNLLYWKMGTAPILFAYTTKLGSGAVYGYDWDYA